MNRQLEGVIAITGEHPPPEFCWWFSGLCDGEGHFFARIDGSRNKRHVNGRVYQYRGMDVGFAIALRADDKPVLEYIRDMLDYGIVMNRRMVKKTSVEGYIARPINEFRVRRIRDCNRLANLFETYPLRSKKALELPLWIRAVRLREAAQLEKARTGTRNGSPYAEGVWLELTEIASQLSELRRFHEHAKDA